MRQIDLEPDEYATKSRSGWQRKSNPKRSRAFFLLAVVMLAVVWWFAAELQHNTLFAITALIAFAGGVVAADWLRDLY